MLKKLISEFRPSKRGVGKVLGSLEADIMEIIWRKGRVSVRDVYETLRLEREIAYTTVMTIMGRLVEKKILAKEREGTFFIYTPTASREEFTTSIVREVVDGLLEEFAEPALAYFIKHSKRKDTEQLDELEKEIRLRIEKGD